jgi:hypothetical protein
MPWPGGGRSILAAVAIIDWVSGKLRAATTDLNRGDIKLAPLPIEDFRGCPDEPA